MSPTFRCGCERSPENTGKRPDGRPDFCKYHQAKRHAAWQAREAERAYKPEPFKPLPIPTFTTPGRSYALAPSRS